MKDYSNESNKYSYILSYKINKKKNIIKVKYANKTMSEVTLNQENYDKIVKKMDEQIKSSNEYKEKINKSISFSKKFLVIGSVSVLIFLGGFIISGFLPEFLLVTSMISIFPVMSLTSLYKKNRILIDIEKNDYYIKNIEEINKEYMNNKNYEKELNKTFKIEKNNTLVNMKFIDGSTLDNYKLKKLKLMKEMEMQYIYQEDYSKTLKK